MKKEIFDGFYAKFDNVKFRPGRGGNYPYVSADDVTDRMNKLFKGNWSSEVKAYYEVGEDVVVRVRVTVLDPDNNMWFYHEGYGGHRKSAGDEAGTGFKSAYSKALVNACRRWGIALYLTDDEPSDPVSTPVQSATVTVQSTPPVDSNGVSNIPPTQVNVSAPPAPANEHMEIPAEVKVSAVPNIPVPGKVNTPPVQGEVMIQQEQVSSPAAANLPKIPVPPVVNGGQPGYVPAVSKSDTALTSTDTTSAIETISDVQKVSIKSLIDIYGVPYDDMAQGALGKVTPIDSLTHSEAISIIQYGHKICKDKK